MNITIDETLKQKLPAFQIAALTFEVNVQDANDELKATMEALGSQVSETLTLEQLLKQPKIASARDAYRTLGKDPSRYRLATESLLRRLIKGNGLYFVNNAVDVGNVLSVKTERSVAVLDRDNIQGDILIRVAGDEPYEGIGRGAINIENIPVYCDEVGPFGSPTSDTMRTAITSQTKNVLVFIISFDGQNELQENIELAQQLFTTHCDAKKFETTII